MGCTQSKIESEEAVARCKERKRFMREAVSTRGAFAAAHVNYYMSLKSTGGALSEYAQYEAQDHRPSQPLTQHPIETLPPPPPLPNFPPPPLQRAVTMPEFSISRVDPRPTDTIQEEDEADMEDESNLIRRGSRGAARTAETADPPRPPSPPPPPPPTSTPPLDNPVPPPPEHSDTTWDYFFSAHTLRPSLSEAEEIKPEKKEDDGEEHDNESNFKENFVADGDLGNKVEPQMPEKLDDPPVKLMKKPKQVVHLHSPSMEAKRIGKVSNANFSQILSDIDDHFLKASESAQEVSKMLEANRLHYHSNFADNRGLINHSAKVMRVITWNRSFKSLANVDDEIDELDSEVNETHAAVLDKLLAWEKKLYDEVKAGEIMKLEYQRKVTLLNKQKKRGTNPEALEKTKAAVSHLHTRYIVDMQSLDSTVAEIERLRDEQLYPKLVALVDGMAQMWEAMHVNHARQMRLAVDLKDIDISQETKETSRQHYERTRQLFHVVQEWQAQLQKVITHQKEYIQALNSWLKLNLIPIESSLKEKVLCPPKVPCTPIQPLLQAWGEQLGKLPDGVARSAIGTFAASIEAIMVQQMDEMKLKEKWEETSKELERREKHLMEARQKYMERRTPPDEMDPDNADRDPFEDKQFMVDSLRKRLEEEKEQHQKNYRQVREKSLVNLKIHLPELCRAMSDFSRDCSMLYKELKSISISASH